MHDDKNEGQDAYEKTMKTVAVTILVMGVSIAIVIVMYLQFGHIGSSFSTGVTRTWRPSGSRRRMVENSRTIAGRRIGVP